MTKLTDLSSDSIDEISGHDYARKYAKQMLKNTLFMGTFQEKRFVEPLNSYRDVITIDQEEEDFIKNLSVVKKKIDEDWIMKPWVGITEPHTVGAPVGYNLWVELKEEVFGKYWYRVKTVEFLRDEIRLKLQIIRPVKREHTPTSSVEERGSEPANNFNFKASLNDTFTQLKQSLGYFWASTVTFENFKQSVIFISLLVVAILTAGVNTIKYLLDYSLKLIRELSGLIKAISPVIISCMNVISRAIFGFYSVIVALFRSRHSPQPVYNSYINFDPKMLPDPRERYNQYFAGQLPYYPTQRSSSGVTITPLN